MEKQVEKGAAAKGCLVIVVVGVILVLAVAMCTAGDSAPKGEPGTVAGLDSEFRDATRMGDTLLVRVTVENAWDDAGWLDGAAGLVQRFGRALKAGELREDEPPLQDVTFAVSVPGIDRLGEPIELFLFKLKFPAEDLRRANYGNLGSAGLLGLVTDIEDISVHGRNVIRAWCADDQRADMGRGFCQRARARPGF